MQIVASAQGETRVQTERGRVDYQCMVPQGPEEAASIGDRGAQHLQVKQQIDVNWGSAEL